MTRKTRPSTRKPGRPAGVREPPPPPYWRLQDAKARFSELVRKVHSEGPQHVTVHGRDEVVVMAAEEFRRLTRARSGADLIAALQACPHPDVELAEAGLAMPVRPVDL